MKRILKRIIQKSLSNFNCQLAYAPRDAVAGLSLTDDLRLAVGRDDPVCFDVGANQGQTIELLRHTFRKPIIYSFEPSRESYAVLESRCRAGDVHLYNLALGSKNAEREFVNYANTCLSSFLDLDSDPQNRFRDTMVKGRELVKVRTLDSVVQEEGIDELHLLKIDTQGFDLQVLRGATESLSAGKVLNVMVELNFVKMYKGQDDAHEIFLLLRDFGFYLIDYYEKVRQGCALGWCTAVYGKEIRRSWGSTAR